MLQAWSRLLKNQTHSPKSKAAPGPCEAILWSRHSALSSQTFSSIRRRLAVIILYELKLTLIKTFRIIDSYIAKPYPNIMFTNISKFRFHHLPNTARPTSNLNRLELPVRIFNQTISAPIFHGSYGHLLFDERWKAKRSIILVRDKFKCAICDDSSNLQVHHRQYHFSTLLNQFKAPWDYADELLVTLCKSCHNKGHNKYKVPTKLI